MCRFIILSIIFLLNFWLYFVLPSTRHLVAVTGGVSLVEDIDQMSGYRRGPTGDTPSDMGLLGRNYFELRALLASSLGCL